jgi:predicted metal-dependent HD superfamily phosphohydrolase
VIGRHDNELQSAQWARQAALDLHCDPASAERIDALVMATQHAVEPATPDAQLLVDVDLGILGASPDRFDQYEVQVRAEYADVPDEVFRPRRRALLQTFLARPAIYGTAHFHALREATARGNLNRSIAALAR